MNNENGKKQILIKQTMIDIAKETSKSFDGINTPEIKMIIEESFNVIKKMLFNGNYIVVQGFGVFFTDYLNEVDIKDPRNNNFVHYEKRLVPRFCFSRNLKKQLRYFNKKK